MTNVNSRAGLWAIVAVMALASAGAIAQTPGGGPPRGMGMGMGAADRPTMIQRLGLDDAALKLSTVQKGQIDKIVDGYLAEQKVLAEKYPMTPGTPPSQEAMMARRSARESLNSTVGKVLDDTQRRTWEATQAARRPMGGPRGPGGEMGPPAAR